MFLRQVFFSFVYLFFIFHTRIAHVGHEVRVTNLYAEQFQPALGGQEHRGFLTAFRDGKVAEDMKSHVEDLQWCSGLVLCYPTWWYSFPAVLKVTLRVPLRCT